MKGILLIVIALVTILAITALKVSKSPTRYVLSENDYEGLRLESIGGMDLPLIIDGEPFPFPEITNECINGLCIEW